MHYPVETMDDSPTGMTSAHKLCRKCGAKLFGKARFCGACLLETALGPLADDDLDLERVDQRSAPMIMQFGDYELLEEIGRGGQGVVYRARQKSLNRTVALKVVGLGHWASTPHLKRFRHEAEAAASLEHPQIVPIYEIGERDGSCYFSMKFVEGGQLDEIVKRQPMSIRRAAELLVKIARTVHYAHERGILHRDIKPGNILLDKKGEPHLSDFGLARLVEQESTVTNSLDVLGTPSYMAPEQAAGHTKELTSAADVYSLGAVFYQLLTGQPPFAGGTTYETIRMVLETEPRNPRLLNPKVDRDLSTICLKSLEKDPKKRYANAEALAQDIEHWLRHEPIRAHSATVFRWTQKWIRRNRTTAALTAALVAFATVSGVMMWNGRQARPLPSGIAVLPFENWSDSKESASFADGIQDDILTKLAKIADLKVISRTSVMGYRGVHDTKKIGQALNVSHILEGSVRKTGDKIHLNVQLIDAVRDSHVWAEQYDRDLSDVFAIQSEVAQRIAELLHARISLAEKLSIQQPPTADLTAFDLYSRAKNLLLTASYGNSGKGDLLHAADLLNQAVARDPAYFQAYCQLAWIHDLLYIFGHDHTPARLALAETAVQAALRLRPDAGEAHLARAENLYRGYLDYADAMAELEIARGSLPNDPRVVELQGYIQRRQGKHAEALSSLGRAIELDPRNVFTLQQIALSYDALRRYAEEKSVLNRALNAQPNDTETKVASALVELSRVELDWKADTRPLHQTIDSIRAMNPDAIRSVSDIWLRCALAERDAVAAKKALFAAPQDIPLNDGAIHFNRPFIEGVIARMNNDETRARSAFIAARAEQQKDVEAQPNYGPPLCVLGLIDAALGRKEEARREGRRAIELLPVEEDAMNGPLMIEYSAMIAAWAGEKDLACEQLATAVRFPSFLSYGQLRLLPFWDPLRGDPRFEKIVNSLAPR